MTRAAPIARKAGWAGLLLATLLATLLMGWPGGARADDADGGDDQAAAGPRFALVQGMPTLTLDARALANAGIVTATPEPEKTAAGVAGFGRILGQSTLLQLRATLASRRAAAALAAARLKVAQAARARADRLYAAERTISAPEREAAHLAEAEAAAAAREAADARTLAEAEATARFGPRVAGALAQTKADGATGAVLAGARLLARVGLAPDAPPITPPATLAALLPDGQRLHLAYLARAQETDPAFPGPVYYYTAASGPGILPGMGFSTILPAAPGAAMLIPQSAVVWLQGSAYVYARTGPGRFVRRRIVPLTAAGDDEYAVRGLDPATALVVVGAGMLLSEEFRAVATAGGDQD